MEQAIIELLNDPEHDGHPLRNALDTVWTQYRVHLEQLEKLTTISDGYQSVLMQKTHTLEERYDRQMRQLRKIVRISDHYQEMLRQTNLALKQASTRDPLTNLANRRLMIERIEAELASAERQGRPLALFLVDIDHFKEINDNLGHDAGDRVLMEIARTLAKELRAYDVCARWGGEEFMVLLPDTPGQGALRVAERLCRNVRGIEFMGLPPGVRVTLSIGVAEWQIGCSLPWLVKRADTALYEAKRSGRNTALLAPPPADVGDTDDSSAGSGRRFDR